MASNFNSASHIVQYQTVKKRLREGVWEVLTGHVSHLDNCKDSINWAKGEVTSRNKIGL
jgi:hypothetical protein